MKRFCALILALLFLLAGCAPAAEDRAETACEYVRTIWEVDYATYSEDAMTEFAKEHYSEGYLEDFLRDPYFNAGVADIKREKLVSRVLGTEHIESTSFEDVDGNTYFTETVKVFVSVDSFEADENTVSYFEAGEVYTLIYDVYFSKDGKIEGFDMAAEEGALLPEGEDRELTETERGAAGDVIREYVYTGWTVDGGYSAEKVLAFYEENLSREFMERDGLTKELLAARENEVKSFDVGMTVTELSVSVAPRKRYATVGGERDFYYWADAEYSVVTGGNAEYLAAVGLKQNMQIKERIYFVIDEGKVTLVGAEYK